MSDTDVWRTATEAQREALVRAIPARRCGECTPGTQCPCEARIWEIHALCTLADERRSTVASVRHPSRQAAARSIMERMNADPTLLFAIRNAIADDPIGNWGSFAFAHDYIAGAFADRLDAFEWMFARSNAEAAAFVNEYEED
jgi:hypothetical protein